MNTIASGMENLIAQHRAYALSGQFSPGSVSWPWAGPANPDILAFYRHYNPVDVLIETGLTPLRFHNTATLAAAQTAYSPRGNEALPPAHWPVNSLVIMDDIGGAGPLSRSCGRNKRSSGPSTKPARCCGLPPRCPPSSMRWPPWWI